eukprot:COSAG01_NODE_11451_length_1930_cov_58.784271_2_plen_74_part_00
MIVLCHRVIVGLLRYPCAMAARKRLSLVGRESSHAAGAGFRGPASSSTRGMCWGRTQSQSAPCCVLYSYYGAE